MRTFLIVKFILLFTTVWGCSLGPQYVKSAIFYNQTDKQIQIVVQFESNVQKTYVVPALGSIQIENVIDKGTWTAVDQIQHISVNVEGQEIVQKTILNSSLKGVEVLNLKFVQEGNSYKLENF